MEDAPAAVVAAAAAAVTVVGAEETTGEGIAALHPQDDTTTPRPPQPQPIIAQDCLRHAMRWMTLRDLAATSRTCHTWRGGALATLRPAGADSLKVNRHSTNFQALLTSSLRRQVSSLNVISLVSDGNVEVTSLLSRDELLAIASAMPHLLSLECGLLSVDDDDAAVAGSPLQHLLFPVRLTTLNLTLRIPSADTLVSLRIFGIVTDPADVTQAAILAPAAWAHIERAMVALASISTLTDIAVKVKITRGRLDQAWPHMPSSLLSPLTKLRKSLKSLSLRLPFGGGSEHIAQLRVLTRLRYLNTGGRFSPDQLRLLFAAPMPFEKLQRLQLSSTNIDEESALVLAQFSRLTKLRPFSLTLQDPSFLASLSELKMARLLCRQFVSVPLLISALAQCTRLHTLVINHRELTNDHLCTLLSALVKMRDLTIDNAQLASLSFASTVPHLATTLRSLCIDRSQTLPDGEATHLRALTALRTLSFRACFVLSPLSEAVIASMTPGADAFDRDCWPDLVTFQHRRR